MISVAELLARFPFVPWRAPVRVTVDGGETRIACRICIAQVGLKEEDVAACPKTPDEFAVHMRTAHGMEALADFESIQGPREAMYMPNASGSARRKSSRKY